MKNLITYLTNRRRLLESYPGNAAAAEIGFLRRSIDLLSGLESVIDQFPGLVDGEQEVNGADLVQTLSSWIDQHLRDV